MTTIFNGLSSGQRCKIEQCSIHKGVFKSSLYIFIVQSINTKCNYSTVIPVCCQVEGGRDKFACSRARGGVMQHCSTSTADTAAEHKAFYLETGGEDNTDQQEMANYTKLSLKP